MKPARRERKACLISGWPPFSPAASWIMFASQRFFRWFGPPFTSTSKFLRREDSSVDAAPRCEPSTSLEAAEGGRLRVQGALCAREETGMEGRRGSVFRISRRVASRSSRRPLSSHLSPYLG